MCTNIYIFTHKAGNKTKDDLATVSVVAYYFLN